MSLEDALNRIAAAMEDANALVRQSNQISSSIYSYNEEPTHKATKTQAPEAPIEAKKKGRPPTKKAEPVEDAPLEAPDPEAAEDEAPAHSAITLEELRAKLITLKDTDLPAFTQLMATYNVSKLPDLKPEFYDDMAKRTDDLVAKAKARKAKEEETEFSLD